MGRYARNSIGQYAPVGAAADDLPGGATPTGKKTIDTTAEVDVASYATAQVVDENLTAENIKKDVEVLGITGEYEGGGGSSDFSTATMTIIASEASSISFPIPCVYEAGELGEGSPAMIYDFFAIESQTGTFTRTIPLYKGSLMIENPFTTGEGLTGNIELLYDGAYAFITGDFTYTE